MQWLHTAEGNQNFIICNHINLNLESKYLTPFLYQANENENDIEGALIYNPWGELNAMGVGCLDFEVEIWIWSENFLVLSHLFKKN